MHEAKRDCGASVNGGGAGGTMMAGTMAYMYWTVQCKTVNCDGQRCDGLHVVKYIGDYDPRGKTFILPAVMPEKFEVQCERCKQVHTYGWKELTARELPDPPEPDFRPWF
jgi:hypothetical protein